MSNSKAPKNENIGKAQYTNNICGNIQAIAKSSEDGSSFRKVTGGKTEDRIKPDDAKIILAEMWKWLVYNLFK